MRHPKLITIKRWFGKIKGFIFILLVPSSYRRGIKAGEERHKTPPTGSAEMKSRNSLWNYLRHHNQRHQQPERPRTYSFPLYYLPTSYTPGDNCPPTTTTTTCNGKPLLLTCEHDPMRRVSHFPSAKYFLQSPEEVDECENDYLFLRQLLIASRR